MCLTAASGRQKPSAAGAAAAATCYSDCCIEQQPGRSGQGGQGSNQR